MPIYSYPLERHVLSGLIKNPKIFADIDRFISEKDFYSDVHSTVYCVIRDCLNKGEKPDKVLLADKIKNLGISFKDDINIYDYIENICFTSVTPKAAFQACQELCKTRIRRELHETFDKCQKFIKTSGDKEVDEIVSELDALYGDKISSYDFDDEPVNIFEGVEDLVEERGNTPSEENGLLTPYPEFNRMFGGLRPGNIYAIASRPAQGKSTFLNDICFRTSLKNKVPALMLDTEMSTVDIQFRMIAALTGVPVWYLESGNWRKNEEMVPKVREAWKQIKDLEYDHYHVASKNIDQICSIIRRWHFSKVGRGNPCIIGYDYIKLTGEKVGQNWAEYQAIGDKIDKLKRMSEEINAPILTAMQLNRGGENQNRSGADVTDDSSVISLSDRLQWYASFVGIFRRKTLDEIALDTPRFGTHKLIPTKTRFQGKDAAGHQDIVRRPMEDGKEKYVTNYLSFSVENFKVEETGSVTDIVEAQTDSPPEDPNETDGEVSLNQGLLD